MHVPLLYEFGAKYAERSIVWMVHADAAELVNLFFCAIVIICH